MILFIGLSRRLPWPCSDARTVLSYNRLRRRYRRAPASIVVSGSHSQGTLGYRLPARSSILRTVMTDTRIVTTLPGSAHPHRPGRDPHAGHHDGGPLRSRPVP